jgi:uncharacterized protein
MERKVLLQCLVGSHNYNLNNEDSDKDYKMFVAPTFDDLYYNNHFCNDVLTPEADYNYHDIRKLSHLFWKSNINFVEILFSNEVHIFNTNPDIIILIENIYGMRNDIASMNLPYFYEACMGMHHNKMKMINKGTIGTQHLVDKFGYDTKQALHAYRLLDFLNRFYDNDFTDFKKAITYDEEEREFMLGIKNGKYTLEEFIKIKDKYFEQTCNLKDSYYSQSPREDIKFILETNVKKIVKIQLGLQD